MKSTKKATRVYSWIYSRVRLQDQCIKINHISAKYYQQTEIEIRNIIYDSIKYEKHKDKSDKRCEKLYT